MKQHHQLFLIVSLLSCATACATIEEAFKPSRTPASRVSPNEIYLGMSMRAVENAWGIPGEVETAGQQTSGNQRWIYRDRGISHYGLGSARVIYFENGQVAGWRTTPDTLAQ
ncbi:MAG: hypothetical protein AB7P04_11115 [Bacteriovoracia bacterium]